MIATFWDQVLHFFGHDKFNVTLWGSTLVLFVWFWLLCGIFMIFDLTGKPKWILKYKTQPDQNAPLDKKKAWSAVKTALFNQTIIGIPLSVALVSLGDYFGYTWKTEDLPTLSRFLIDMLTFIVIEEVWFYYSHRLFHWPPLYKRFHKKHHEWTAPIGVIALYAHPLEHIISNHTPVGLGPALMGSHLFTAWVWYALALFSTITTHSGYHLPFMPSPEFHDFHHLKFNYNYGTIGLLDWIHGTDKMFKKMVHYKRHRLLTELTPVNERYPDPKKESRNNSNGVTNGLLKND